MLRVAGSSEGQHAQSERNRPLRKRQRAYPFGLHTHGTLPLGPCPAARSVSSLGRQNKEGNCCDVDLAVRLDNTMLEEIQAALGRHVCCG